LQLQVQLRRLLLLALSVQQFLLICKLAAERPRQAGSSSDEAAVFLPAS
jgi:hypothetical protein